MTAYADVSTVQPPVPHAVCAISPLFPDNAISVATIKHTLNVIQTGVLKTESLSRFSSCLWPAAICISQTNTVAVAWIVQ